MVGVIVVVLLVVLGLIAAGEVVVRRGLESRTRELNGRLIAGLGVSVEPGSLLWRTVRGRPVVTVRASSAALTTAARCAVGRDDLTVATGADGVTITEPLGTSLGSIDVAATIGMTADDGALLIKATRFAVGGMSVPPIAVTTFVDDARVRQLVQGYRVPENPGPVAILAAGTDAGGASVGVGLRAKGLLGGVVGTAGSLQLPSCITR